MAVYVEQSSLSERGLGRPKAATELPNGDLWQRQGVSWVLDRLLEALGDTENSQPALPGDGTQVGLGRALVLGSGILSGKIIPS